MLSVRPFDARATVTVTDEPVGIANDIEAHVQRIWEAEQARRGRALFNGRIVSASAIAHDGVRATVTEYRHLVAQRVEPDLFESLRVRPVAVSGLLECADGIVFGRRAAQTTQSAGAWELCPSGGLDASQGASGAFDYTLQILAELHEELGLDREAVSDIVPFCLIEDGESHVIDIGIALRTTMGAREIAAAHASLATDEYDEVAVIARDALPAFINAHAGGIVDVSLALLREYGVLAD